VRHTGLTGQALKSILHGGGVVQSAVEAGAVVMAHIVLEKAFPLFQRPWSYAVPELLLNGALDPLHLPVEVGTARPDVGMTNAETVEEAGEIVAEPAYRQAGSEPLSVWMQRRGKGMDLRRRGRARQTAAVVRRSKTVAARKRLQSSMRVSWKRPWGRYLRSICARSPGFSLA